MRLINLLYLSKLIQKDGEGNDKEDKEDEEEEGQKVVVNDDEDGEEQMKTKRIRNLVASIPLVILY